MWRYSPFKPSRTGHLIFNKQFQSAFSAKDIYSKDEFDRHCNIPGAYPTCDDLHITENGVRKLLQNLNPNKASGPDNIKPRILKELSSKLALILTIIFNVSLETGSILSDWRSANASQIIKKENATRQRNIDQSRWLVFVAKLWST